MADAKIKSVALLKAHTKAKWKKDKDIVALAVAQSEWEGSFGRLSEAECCFSSSRKEHLRRMKNRLAGAIHYANKQLTKQVVAEAERRRK